jgi:hypothetical protein
VAPHGGQLGGRREDHRGLGIGALDGVEVVDHARGPGLDRLAPGQGLVHDQGIDLVVGNLTVGEQDGDGHHDHRRLVPRGPRRPPARIGDHHGPHAAVPPRSSQRPTAALRKVAA